MSLAQLPLRSTPAPAIESETALAAALDCLRTAITIFDSSQRLIYANAHFKYLLPRFPDPSKLLGVTYEELIEREIEEGLIALSELRDGIPAFIARRRTQLRADEYRPLDIALADGRIIEIKARRTKENGWILLWGDATAARHLQGRLEEAISLSADAFAFFDARGTLCMCNRVFAELHGAPDPETLAGATYRELIKNAAKKNLFVVAGDREQWIERRMEAHASAAGALTVETKAGTAYLVRERATRDGGRVTVFTDVTETRRVEVALAEQGETLQKTREALAITQGEKNRQAGYLANLAKKLDKASQEADTTKTTILRTMSHELKTPLNAIIGFSDLLRSMADRLGPAQVAEYAGLIHHGGNNLLRLINQILDLSKIAANRYELHKSKIDAGATMWVASEGASEKARARSLTIDASACPVGLEILADEQAFTGMITQLIDNAINFTQGGGVIRLSVTRKNDRIFICVSDNGPGVEKKDIARILEPFEQAGRGPADHTGGAGLGLTLVKATAELHGGSLSVESAPGKGFTATISLPAA